MRLLPILLIVFAVLISVGAISSLTDIFGVGVQSWYGPLGVLQTVYTDLMGNAFGRILEMLDNRWDIVIPAWLPHAAVLYIGAGLAFVAGTAGIAHREKITETVKATALGTIMPLAIPLFVWHIFRLGLVSRFARDNTLSFFAYVALVAGAYFGSVVANNQIYKPRALEQQEQSLPAQAGAAPVPVEQALVDADRVREKIAAMGAMDHASQPVAANADQQQVAYAGMDNVIAAMGSDRKPSVGIGSAIAVSATLSNGGHIVPASYTPDDARSLGEELGRALSAHAEGGPASPLGQLEFVDSAHPDGIISLEDFEREMQAGDTEEN